MPKYTGLIGAIKRLDERLMDLATTPGESIVSMEEYAVWSATKRLPRTLSACRQVQDACAASWQDAGGLPSDNTGYRLFLSQVLP